MRALKALLAIQDAVVRHSVRSFLRWEQYSIDTVEEVTCTADVVSLLMQTQIDIVILDMQMTVKPDQAFFRSIRLYNQDAVCIVIGTAQDFAAVSGSDTYEVFQFLLKPLNLEVLQFSLSRCVHWLEEMENYEQSFSVVQEQLQRAKTVSIQNLALDMFHGAVTPTQSGIDKRLADLGIAFSFPIYYCVSGDIVSPHSVNVNHNLWFGAIRERIRENFPYLVNGQVMAEALTAFDGDRIAMIIGCRQRANVETSWAMVHTAFSALKKTFGLDYILSFSVTTDTLLGVPPLYRQSCSACQYYRFVRRCGIYLAAENDQCARPSYFISAERKAALRTAVTERAPEQIPGLLENIRQELLATALNQMEYLSLAITDLMLTGVSLLESRDVSLEQFYGMECFTQQFFVSFTDIRSLFAWLEEYFQVVYRCYHSATDARNGSNVVARIKSYTQEHYSQPLTLKYVGETLHYSPNYLGRIFYKSERIRYSAYLHQVRIKAAATLLATTELAPTYIAEQVGYRDTAYFHQMFRQIMGVTPKAYRTGLTKQREQNTPDGSKK